MALGQRRCCGHPSPSELEQAASINVQQFLSVLGAERQRLQPFGAGPVFGERVIDREQDTIDAHLHHAAHKRSIREEAARRDPEMLAEDVAEGLLLPKPAKPEPNRLK